MFSASLSRAAKDFMGQANDGNGDEQVGPESKDALEEPRAGVVGARYSFRC